MNKNILMVVVSTVLLSAGYSSVWAQAVIATVPGVAVQGPSSEQSENPFYYDARSLEAALQWMEDAAPVAKKVWSTEPEVLARFTELLDKAREEISPLMESYKDKTCSPDVVRVSFSASLVEAYRGLGDASRGLIGDIAPSAPPASYIQWKKEGLRVFSAGLNGQAKPACRTQAK